MSKRVRNGRPRHRAAALQVQRLTGSPRFRSLSVLTLSRGAALLVSIALRPRCGVLKFLLGPLHVAGAGAFRSGFEVAFNRRLVGGILLALVVALGRCGAGEAAEGHCRCRCRSNQSEPHWWAPFGFCENNALGRAWFICGQHRVFVAGFSDLDHFRFALWGRALKIERFAFFINA
jgi:hypothetical protein